MTLFPDVQRKACEEIESIVGKDTLPTYEDSKRLPYVCAVLKEVLRIAPVAPMGGYLYQR